MQEGTQAKTQGERRNEVTEGTVISSDKPNKVSVGNSADYNSNMSQRHMMSTKYPKAILDFF